MTVAEVVSQPINLCRICGESLPSKYPCGRDDDGQPVAHTPVLAVDYCRECEAPINPMTQCCPGCEDETAIRDRARIIFKTDSELVVTDNASIRCTVDGDAWVQAWVFVRTDYSRCAHSACSQNFIDTGDKLCVERGKPK